MSFIYSQALVEASLGVRCLDTDASQQLSGNPTPRPCLWHVKTTEPFRLSRFGMTCELLTEGRGEELLTWWLAGFPAKTSALQEKAQASQASEAGCGVTWPGSLARFDPVTSSWKTAQPSLLEDSELCSVIWPRSGMTAGGRCWELPMLGRRTSATGSGLWPGTPTATMSVRSERFRRGAAPTPAEFIKWPTPRCQMTRPVKIRLDVEKGHKGNLEEVVALRMWPTPTAYNAKETNALSEAERNTPTLTAQIGGSLNPNWVEWLMGWPIGHTDLKQLATDKYRFAPQPHSECSQVNLSEVA